MDRIWRLLPRFVFLSIGPIDIGIIFFFVLEILMMLIHVQHSVNSDWQFNTQSVVLRADWLILAILNIDMPY